VQRAELVQLAEQAIQDLQAPRVQLDSLALQVTLVIQVQRVIQETRAPKDQWGYQEKHQILARPVIQAQLAFKVLVVKHQILAQLATQATLDQLAQQGTQALPA